MAMDPLSSSYLSSVAASFTISLVTAAGRKIEREIAGTPKEQALRKAVEVGILAMLADAKTISRDEKNLLDDVFREFFRSPEVAEEMSPLLWGRSLDVGALSALFEEAGFVPDELPGLDFSHAIAVFQAAFLEQASEDPDLQRILQTRLLLEQLSTQRSLLEAVRELLAFLKGVDLSKVAVTVGRIIVAGLEGQRKVYKWIPVEAAPVDWEAHYLKTLISKCEPLDLSPIDESLAEYSRPVRVSDVFTTLNLDGVTRRKDETVAEAIEKLLNPSGDRMAIEREEAERVPIQAVEAVAGVQRLVILGKPGSGKSTLTNYIATQLARKRLGMEVSSGSLPGWPEDESPLPVRIVLRRFAAWIKADGQGNAGDVWDYLEHMLNEWGCKEAFPHVKRTLIEKGGIVFFDGLDEVQETDEAAKRTKIIAAIRDFIAPLDKVKVLVTCRNYAYERKKDPWHLPEDTFPVFRLAGFSKKQIQYFVHAWYHAVRTIRGWDEERADQEADDLFEKIVSQRHILDLARNPLLLTLIAQVHGSTGYLPKNRADLYDKAVDLLLARWENRLVRDEKGNARWEPGVIARLGIRTSDLRKHLEVVAFNAHERQESEENRDGRAADIPHEGLGEELKKLFGGSLDKAEEVLEYIQERAGLLVARDNRTYAFPHRSFQEYLAAMYIMRKYSYNEMLAERVRRDYAWWREVFLLAAGANRNTPVVVYNIVNVLLPYSPGTGKKKWEVTEDRALHALLAAQTLLETDFNKLMLPETGSEPGKDYFRELYDRIRDWLIACMVADAVLGPHRRNEAGNILARLGDPRPGVGLDDNGLPDIAWSELIEPGPFIMGNTEKTDPMAYDDEHPQFTCHLIKRPYKISKYPVTVAQYKAFVNNGGYKERKYWTESGWEWKEASGVEDPRSYGEPVDLDNHPRVGVSWYEAVAFTRWLSEKLGKDIRLPTEAQWERAARHTDGRRYPWSPDRDEKPDPNRANYDDTGLRGTSAVGIFPGGSAECGAEEMSGNVLEWCSTKWLENYEEYEKKVDDDLEGDDVRVLRGGSWISNVRLVRCAYRLRDLPGDRYLDLGFRVVCLPSHTSEC